jgi:membrane associated rhomboid family serine protease
MYNDRYRYSDTDIRLSIGPPLSPAVKWLLVIITGCFIFQNLAGDRIVWFFGLVPGVALPNGYLWQFASYLFLHVGIAHLFFNMLALWMFGCDVEQAIGSRRFLFLFFFSGIGAGVCAYIFYPMFTVIMGASGAVFGVIVAFAMLFPERVVTLLLFFVIPVSMKAKYLALIFAGIELLFVIGHGEGDTVAHFAHLGGAFFGYAYIRWLRKRESRPTFLKSSREPLDRVDLILDKVLKGGLSSLSEEERELLRQAARKRNESE